MLFFIGHYVALNGEYNPRVQGQQINCALQIPQMKTYWLPVSGMMVAAINSAIYQLKPTHICLFIYIICNTTADQLKTKIR